MGHDVKHDGKHVGNPWPRRVSERKGIGDGPPYSRGLLKGMMTGCGFAQEESADNVKAHRDTPEACLGRMESEKQRVMCKGGNIYCLLAPRPFFCITLILMLIILCQSGCLTKKREDS